MSDEKIINDYCEVQKVRESKWIDHYLNKSTFNNYNPVISDDIVFLSVSRVETAISINVIVFQIFSIVLKI